MFLYSVVTKNGSKFTIEAESGEEALRLLNIDVDTCKRWYPFAIKRVLTAEEKAKLAKVKADPIYKENSKLKAKVKRRAKVCLLQ